MVQSVKSRTTISRRAVRDVDDLYPDYTATPVATSATPQAREFSIKDTGSTQRLDGNEVPSTTRDMNRLFTWKHGDKIFGTHAKSNKAMNAYRNDINKGWGRDKFYKDIYIDTLHRRKVSDQLEEPEEI